MPSNTYKILQLPSEVYERSQSPVRQTTMTGALVDKVIYSEHGILTYLKGVKYPLKGMINDLLFNDLDSVKKYIKNWLKFFGSKPMVYVTPILFILFGKRLLKKWIELTSDYLAHHLLRHFMLAENMSKPARELLRTCLAVYEPDYVFTPDHPKWLTHAEILIKSVALMLNSDPAYKYRFMDIIQLLDREALKTNPSKEIKRLFSILSERDGQRNWDDISRLLSTVLWINKSIRNQVVEIGTKLDLNEFMFDEADLYACLINSPAPNTPEYDILGLAHEERQKLWDRLNENVV